MRAAKVPRLRAERTEELSHDVSLQASDDFRLRPSFLDPAVPVGTGSRTIAESHDHDHVHTLKHDTEPRGLDRDETLPAEVARRLGIPPGQRLDWIEDGLGGFRMVPHSEDLEAAMAAQEAIMAEYDGVFRELAK